MRRAGLVIAIFGLAATSGLMAQVVRLPAAPKTGTTAARPKLTRQQQEALKILKAQTGIAKGLSPVMRTFALFEIARGYESIHDPRTLATLKDAFQASQTIEDEDSRNYTKRSLQDQIVRRLVVLDPNYCERLLTQLSGPARKSVITELVKRYTREKQFNRAVILLNELGDEEFPYVQASHLMQALPAQMSADRQNLFSEALSSYTRHEHKDNSLDDFGVFVERTWRGLPPDLVLQAIDEILKQARDSDRKMEITVGAAQGSASFTSAYQYTLFQVLPVLRELDPDRADQLLQQNHDLQSTIQHYPNGLQSLDPRSGTPDSITMHDSSGSESSASDRYQDELQRRANEIVDEARKDPKQALSAAMSLPDFRGARVGALLDLAAALSKAAPTYAREALSESLKGISSVESDMMQASLLARIVEGYLKLGDPESAKEVVVRGFKIAEKLYETDIDADDPNLASKAEWPSTATWKKFTSLLARTSPSAALDVVNDIPDAEIQTLERIAVADGLLGAGSGFELVGFKGKHNSNYSVSTN